MWYFRTYVFQLDEKVWQYGIKVTVKKLSDAVADFNLVGAPNACTDAAVSGNYVYGIPLTNDHNIVVVKVNVTAIGAYTIRIDTLGEISFSAAGFLPVPVPKLLRWAGAAHL